MQFISIQERITVNNWPKIKKYEGVSPGPEGVAWNPRSVCSNENLAQPGALGRHWTMSCCKKQGKSRVKEEKGEGKKDGR